MTSADFSDQNSGAHQPATSRLEDLIPIAAVIAAGCESCAESLVKRALGNGTARPLIKLTLGIVARLRSTDCFVQAVGAEVAARMDKPLAAGRKALREPKPQAEASERCALPGPPVAPGSRLV